MKSWHTSQERRLIKNRGGIPRISYGYDGVDNGKPVEVRSQRKDSRFRIQKNVHQQLVRRGGYYIFSSPNHSSKRISAKRVSNMLPDGAWYKDREYPHKFVSRNDVWKKKK